MNRVAYIAWVIVERVIDGGDPLRKEREMERYDETTKGRKTKRKTTKTRKFRKGKGRGRDGERKKRGRGTARYVT